MKFEPTHVGCYVMGSIRREPPHVFSGAFRLIPAFSPKGEYVFSAEVAVARFHVDLFCETASYLDPCNH